MNTIMESIHQFLQYTGFVNMTIQHFGMICVGIFFIWMIGNKKWRQRV